MKKIIHNHICVICNSNFDSSNKRDYKCDSCEEKIKQIKKVETVDKAEKSLLQKSNLKNWQLFNERTEKAAEAVRERVLQGKDNFGSKKEAVIAIQLERDGILYETQKNIGGYKVDFFLPKLKIVLEIDGTLFHTNEDETFLRDRRLMSCLGEDYEIIHLEDDVIPSYTWNLCTTLPMIIEQRNENHRFRDTRSDSMFLKMIVGSRKR